MAMSQSGIGYTFQAGETNLRRAPQRLGFKPTYKVLLDEDLGWFTELVHSVDRVSFDTETTALYIDTLTPVSMNMTVAGENYIAYMKHHKAPVLRDPMAWRNVVHYMLTKPRCYMFNAPFDLLVVRKQWDLPVGIYEPIDAQSLVFLADTNIKLPNLKDSERFFLGVDPPDFSWFGEAILDADPDELNLYQAFDSWGTFMLGELLYDELNPRYSLAVQADRKIIGPVTSFSDEEFDLDVEHLEKLHDEVVEEIEKVVSGIHTEVGPFNIASNQAVGKKLLELGYDTGVRTKPTPKNPLGAMSVASKALAGLRDCPLADKITAWRKLSKLSSSYIQPLMFRVTHGLPIRFRYMLNNVPTMRLSASGYSAKTVKKSERNRNYYMDMNFQAISKPKQEVRKVWYDPISLWSTYDQAEGEASGLPSYWVETGSNRMDLRKAFVPPGKKWDPYKPGQEAPDDEWVYCPIDFAGQELRIAGSLSGETVWIKAFAEGRDIHTETAKAIWGPENYNKNLRKKAKIASFLIIYGGGAHTLSSQMGMTIAEAEDFIQKYMTALPRLASWIQETRAKARRCGFIITPFKVPRRLSYYYRMGKSWAGYADRSAVNTNVQGSAGMMIRIALIRLYKIIGQDMQTKYRGDVRFRGCIHDELDFAIRKSRFVEFINEVTELMVSTAPKTWAIPMDVEVSIGRNWGEVFPVDHHSYPFMPKVSEPPSSKEAVSEPETIADFLDHLVDSDADYSGDGDFTEEDLDSFEYVT